MRPRKRRAAAHRSRIKLRETMGGRARSRRVSNHAAVEGGMTCSKPAGSDIPEK